MSDDRPYWLAEPCPPWCWGNHKDDDEVEDRLHIASWETRITLTLEAETDEEALLRLRRGYAFQPPQLHIDLLQDWREVEPRLWIGWVGRTGVGPCRSLRLGSWPTR